MAAKTRKAPQPAGDGSPPAARPGLIGTALVDSQGAWEVVDTSLCELLGRRERELLSRPASMVLASGDEPRERARLDELLAGTLPGYRSEARVLHGDGHEVCVLLEAVAVYDGDEPPRCVLALQDVTARKELEDGGTGWAMAADDLDQGPALVAVKGLDGLHLRINSQFARAFAVSDERLRGRDDGYLFPASIAAALREGYCLEVAATPEAVERVDVISRASGDEPMCFARFALRGATGQPYAVCTLAVDRDQRDGLDAQLAHLLDRERAAHADACEMRAQLLADEATGREAAAEARDQVLAGTSSTSIATLVEATPPLEPGERAIDSAVAAEGTPSARSAASSKALDAERAARVEAEAERDRVRVENDALAEELVEERRSAAVRRDELKTLRASLAQFEQALQTEHEAQAQAEAEHDRVREEVDAHRGELARERAGHAEARAELEEIQGRLERAGHADAQAELSQLRERLSGLEGAHVSELERERQAAADAQARVAQLQAEMSALQAEIRTEHDLRARVNGLDEQLKAECQTRAQVEAERDCLREEIGAHDQELERERVAAAALQADLSALRRGR